MQSRRCSSSGFQPIAWSNLDRSWRSERNSHVVVSDCSGRQSAPITQTYRFRGIHGLPYVQSELLKQRRPDKVHSSSAPLARCFGQRLAENLRKTYDQLPGGVGYLGRLGLAKDPAISRLAQSQSRHPRHERGCLSRKCPARRCD